MSPILLTILGILAFLLAYILFVPIRLNMNLAYNETLLATTTVAFFPFRRQFKSERKHTEKLSADKPGPQRSVDAKKKSKKGFDFSKLDHFDRPILLKTLRESLRFIGRLIRTPDYYLRAQIVGGSEEPDVTGQLYGAYWAVKPLLPSQIAIVYSPDFLMGTYHGELNLGMSLRVYDIVKEITVFLFRIPAIKLFKLYRKLKRRNDDK